jgi:hypothetical protein
VKLVIVESPYGAPDAETIDRNVRYARAAVADCLRRGEAPYASHLFFTQPGILRDEVPEERQLGIDAGLAWGLMADVTVVYADLGVSRGMRYGIEHATRAGRPIEVRALTHDELERAIGPRALALRPSTDAVCEVVNIIREIELAHGSRL